MKLIIKDRDNVYLKCKHKKIADKILKMNLETIVEWYPLSLAYDLTVDSEGDYLRLCRLTSTLPYHYGDEGQGYVIDKQGIDTDIHFEGIYQENKRLINKAKDYGLLTLEDEYTINEVVENFAKVRLIFEEINAILIENHIKSLTPEDKAIFLQEDRDIQVDKALRNSSDDLTGAYDDLGQLYNMNVIMKKISTINHSLGQRNRLEGLEYMLKD